MTFVSQEHWKKCCHKIVTNQQNVRIICQEEISEIYEITFIQIQNGWSQNWSRTDYYWRKAYKIIKVPQELR